MKKTGILPEAKVNVIKPSIEEALKLKDIGNALFKAHNDPKLQISLFKKIKINKLIFSKRENQKLVDELILSHLGTDDTRPVYIY